MSTIATSDLLFRIVTLLERNFIIARRSRGMLLERLLTSIGRLELAVNATPQVRNVINDEMHRVKQHMVSRSSWLAGSTIP